MSSPASRDKKAARPFGDSTIVAITRNPLKKNEREGISRQSRCSHTVLRPSRQRAERFSCFLSFFFFF